MEGLRASVELGLSLFGKLDQLVKELLPRSLTPRLSLYNLQGEALECPPLLCFLAGLLFVLRLLQCLRRRLYLRREKQLAETLAACVEEKCHLADRLSTAHEEHAGLESSLGRARRERESLDLPRLTEDYRTQQRLNVLLREELRSLLRQLEEERSRASEQEEQMVALLSLLESPEDLGVSTSQGAAGHLPGAEDPALKGCSPGVGLGGLLSCQAALTQLNAI
ncbi:Putative protein cTAGE-6 [Tupaia chinensis]|uniref:Uncharacterized protein n=1 Tax=Tupaia chinensis TaxID=246437 RepID=L9K724_TUPCH|nr:Putative protein cTAGE-6 [Tupaia chinensis]